MYAKSTLAALALGALSASCALADPPEPPPPPVEAAADSVEPSTAVPADADIYVYPSKGQTDKQLDRDRYECHNWAVSQSHFNPSEPHLAPHQQIRVVEGPPPGQSTVAGAVTGAVIGAAVGSPRNTGEGAVAGAIAGAVLGASSESARRKETDRINSRVNADAQAERARLERQASDYRRAISACLEGRGYTVK
jgi:glycine zipper 2TM protein